MRRRRPHYWIVVAAVLVAGVWLFAAPGAAPLYDGPGNPDEPYRYVVAPPGYQHTAAPTAAVGTVAVRDGISQDTYVQSAEAGPQIDIFFPQGTLRVPGGLTSVQVRGQPVAPPPLAPADGRIIGNVYRVSVVSAAGPLTVAAKGSEAPTIEMRAPNGKQVGPQMETTTGRGWHAVRTDVVAADVYRATLDRLGDWALVQVGHYVGSGRDRRFVAGARAAGGSVVLPVTLGVALGVVIAAILGVRFGRTRRRPAETG